MNWRENFVIATHLCRLPLNAFEPEANVSPDPLGLGPSAWITSIAGEKGSNWLFSTALLSFPHMLTELCNMINVLVFDPMNCWFNMDGKFYDFFFDCDDDLL